MLPALLLDNYTVLHPAHTRLSQASARSWKDNVSYPSLVPATANAAAVCTAAIAFPPAAAVVRYTEQSESAGSAASRCESTTSRLPSAACATVVGVTESASVTLRSTRAMSVGVAAS